MMKTLKKGLDKILKFGITPKAYKWINYVFFAYVIVWLLYIAGFIFNWQAQKRANLPDLIALGTLMVSPAALAFFVAFLKAKTDKDHNGIPDLIEEKTISNKINISPGRGKERGANERN